ncbi:cytochrome c biogenesis CcdA family protein [Luteipulveratus flavus]|uniref:cytochrome c biogenesis CcdA family protein n=1 Tax=Luteipulveratus flavus TaxID=3031728 RepID=UPI0039083C03
MINWLGPAFIAGFLAIASPCTLPILPGLATVLAQPSAPDIDGRHQALVRGSSFAAGAAFSMAAIVWIGTTFAQTLLVFSWPLCLLPGMMLIVVGVATVKSTSARLFRGRAYNSAMSSGHPFVIGCALSLGWTPCLTPSLAVAYSAASNTRSLGWGIILCLFYMLGISLPFVLLGFGAWRIRPLRRLVSRSGRAIQIGSGAVLGVLGVIIASGFGANLTTTFLRLSA